MARNTVAEAYAQLAGEGWLQTRVGAGTWVAARPDTDRPVSQPSTPRHGYELRGGLVDTSDFPRTAWSRATRDAVLQMSHLALGYPDPLGVPELRANLASYMGRTRGVAATADHVVVGHGFGDLLSVLCRVLRAGGARRVAVEEYGHCAHRRVIIEAGLEPVPIAVDAEGMVVDELVAVRDLSAVLVTPGHQFPTGSTLSSARRRAMVSWAARTGAYVLEDDYDGEFRFDRRSVGSLQPLAPDRVVYLATASKALAPAVGLAWAALPPPLAYPFERQRRHQGGSPSSLLQHTFVRFLDDFEYDRAVRRRRAMFRRRRAALVADLAERAPAVGVLGHAAGLQCVVQLPGRAAEDRVVEAAAARGVTVEGLADYRFRCDVSTDSRPLAGIVVGYGAPPPGGGDRALTLLVDAIVEALGAAEQGPTPAGCHGPCGRAPAPPTVLTMIVNPAYRTLTRRGVDAAAPRREAP